MIFHLALVDAFAGSQRSGVYERSTRDQSLAEVGFIHCSSAEQLPRTIEKFYADLDAVVLVAIAEDGLDVRWEPADGQLFPHIYAPLLMTSVVGHAVFSPARGEAPPVELIARRGDVVEELHGVQVADPYRWLEDVDSDETRAWVRAQAAHAEAWLAALPARAEIRDALTAIWDRPTEGAPSERGGRWLQWRNSGLQQQPVLHVGDSPDAIDTVLLDPNTLSTDGTTAVTGTATRRDGSLVAYALSEAGSDWMTWRVRDVASGADVADEVVGQAKFVGAVWLPDGSGFVYGAPTAPTPGQELVEDTGQMRLLVHRLGTSSAADEVLFTPAEASWFPDVQVTEDGRWLIVYVTAGTAREAQIHVRDLADPSSELTPLVPDMSVVAGIVDATDDGFLVHTNSGAERYRLMRVRLAAPEREEWVELVGERPATLLGVHAVGSQLLCHWLADAASRLTLHARTGEQLRELDVPPATTVGEISGHPGQPLVHWTTTSASDPGSTYQLDLSNWDVTRVRSTPLPLAPVVNEQVFVESYDGTRVPVFLTRRADVVVGSDAPGLVYGYGGFNHPITPTFSSAFALWVERGGVLATACLRGGGEYGAAWHDAGRLVDKENVFDDACAVAAWLASSGWSRPERIGLTGRSNGGLLAAACLLRHPELFGAVVPEVGVLDMLRFHLFTIGWAWRSDYGDPAVAEDFEVLRRYSPLHNIVPGQALPPVLVTTGDHDDRVVPAHSFKFTAELQRAVPVDSGPVLMRVDIAAGHGAGKPTAKAIAERADVLAFLDAMLSGG